MSMMMVVVGWRFSIYPLIYPFACYILAVKERDGDRIFSYGSLTTHCIVARVVSDVACMFHYYV